MICKLNVKDEKTAKEIIALQQKSYSIEAMLIGFNNIPPLKDNVSSIEKSNEAFYGYYIDEELVGLISYELEDNMLDICRVAVHPDYFRRGIGSELLKFVEELNTQATKITVSTGFRNQPAIELYLKNGFIKKEIIEVEKRLLLIKLEKTR